MDKLEFIKCDDVSYDVYAPDGLNIIGVLRCVNGGKWMSYEHDSDSFYFDSSWHRQIADKLDELNNNEA